MDQIHCFLLVHFEIRAVVDLIIAERDVVLEDGIPFLELNL